jgi:bifunctional DNA-binding transcriptional regulator/antitoxin component of YhaV-PrlF toxin-antitoxin module
MVTKVRERGSTTISSKNQVTIPTDALRKSGLSAGDRVRATVAGPGRVLLERQMDPIERYAGALTGVYPADYLDDLRSEWH